MARLPAPFIKRRPRLEIVPFIDIMFFLLVTFLMVSMKLIPTQGIAVRLPETTASDTESNRDEVSLSVTESNTLFWNQENIPYEMLETRLKFAKAASPHFKVFINGDERANFQKIIEVLDKVRNAGITAVTIGTHSSLAQEKP